MNTDQNIWPRENAKAAKQTAGEAIGHPQRDLLDSRPSLIGLMNPTTTPADHKGYF